jgi:predicted kinase
MDDVQTLRQRLGPLPEPMVYPPFIVVAGLPGTGKSYLCHRLAERFPLLILESDALRQTLFDHPSYGPEESARLFRAIHLLIEQLLKKGIPLALDATNLSESNREYLYHIAERWDVKLILVWVEAPDDVVRQRLEERSRTALREDNSQADWSVYLKMRDSAQPIRRHHFVVDTSRDISPVLMKIAREANR